MPGDTFVEHAFARLEGAVRQRNQNSMVVLCLFVLFVDLPTLCHYTFDEWSDSGSAFNAILHTAITTTILAPRGLQHNKMYTVAEDD